MTAYCEECDTVQPVRVLHDDDYQEPGGEPITVCCACGAEVCD